MRKMHLLEENESCLLGRGAFEIEGATQMVANLFWKDTPSRPISRFSASNPSSASTQETTLFSLNDRKHYEYGDDKAHAPCRSATQDW
jgi:hypothetical protein